jgi:hypothetical protein
MALTIQEFNSAFAKTFKEYFDNQSMEAVRNSAFTRIYDVSDTTEYTTSYISTEGSDQPEYFDEGNPLKRSQIGKGYRVTYSKAEFGKIMSITKKARLKVPDTTEAIAEIANSQKTSALVTMNSFLERETWSLLSHANGSNGSYKILAPDGVALYGTHTWNSTGGTFNNNLGTAAINLALAQAVEAYGGAFTDANGDAMPLNFNRIFVKTGGAASRQAKSVYAAMNAQGQYQVATLGDINIYQGSVQVIEIPWMTSGNDYVYVADTMALGIENPLFVEFIQRPMAEGTFKESDNLSWDMPYSASFAYGIKNLPINILGGKIA